ASPSTSRRPSTLPFSSTTALRTTVPSAPTERASAGYFGGTLRTSRFSAPLEERMIALLSPGSSALDEDEAAVAASFLLSLGLLASTLIATGAAAIVALEVGGATGAVAAAELVAASGTVDGV